MTKNKNNQTNKENTMKKITIITMSLLLFAGGLSFAQSTKNNVQKGFVRTIGRYYDSKDKSSVYRVSGVNIQTECKAAATSEEKGLFQLNTVEKKFTLTKVSKKGFRLVVPNDLPKTMICNPNDLELVMADLNEEIRFKRDTEKKIEAALRIEYNKKLSELDSLYKQSEISRDQWIKKYNELVEREEKDREMVKKIAEEYSEIDFAEMDETKKKIAELIINGKVKEARELMYKNGYVPAKIDDWKDKDKTVKERRKELELQLKEVEDAEKVLEKEKDDLSYYCAEFARSFEIEHAHDSALFYLKKRCELDTLNTLWISEVANYYCKYTGNYDEALKLLNKALAIQNKISDSASLDLAGIYYKIGRVYSDKGNLDEALKWNNKALSIEEQVLDPLSPALANTYNNIGLVYLKKGNLDEALKWLDKALSIEEQVLDPLSISLATSYHNIGSVYSDKGNLDEALKWNDKALKIFEQVLDSLSLDLAGSYNNKGTVYAKQGNFGEALKLLNKALQIREQVLDPLSSDLAIAYNNIGYVYKYKGDYDEALKWYKKALQIREQVLDPLSPDLAIGYNNIGTIYDNKRNFNEALKWYDKALQIREQVLEPFSPALAISYDNIGLVYSKQGNYDEALIYSNKALKIFEQVLDSLSPDLAIGYNNMGFIYSKKGDLDEALKWNNKALMIREQILDSSSLDLAISYNNIGTVYSRKGYYDEALEYFNKALPGFIKAFGEEHANTKKLKERIEQCKQALEK